MDQDIKLPTNKIRTVSFLSLSMIIHASLAVTALFMNSDIIQPFPEEKPAFHLNTEPNKTELVEISTTDTASLPAQDLSQPAAANTTPTSDAATAAEIAEITQNLEPKIKQETATDSEIIVPAKVATKIETKPSVKKALPIAKAKVSQPKVAAPVIAQESAPEVTESAPAATDAKPIEIANDDSDIEQAQKDLDEEQSKVETEQNEKIVALEKEQEEEQQNFLAEQKQKRDAQEAAALAEIKSQQEQEAIAAAAEQALQEQAERKEKVKAMALAKYEAQERKKAALAAQKAEEQRQASLQAAQEAAASAAAKQAAEESLRNSSGGGSNFAQTSEQTGSDIRSLAELRQMPGNKRPAYDSEDRLQKRTGEIVFLAFISKEGTPTEFKLVKSTGHRSLDAKTLKTVKQWKFYPGQEGWVEIPLNWNLKGEAQEMPSTLRRKVSQN